MTTFIVIFALFSLYNTLEIESLSSASTQNIFNPFSHFHIESHKSYLFAALSIIIFLLIKLLAETKYRYCYFAKCNGGDSTNSCTEHLTCVSNFIPESAILVTAGALPAIILSFLDINIGVSLDPQLVFNVLLVPIVMSAGWRVDKMVFYRNLGTILVFAIIGTILNAAILTPLFYYGSKSRWGIFSSIDMDMIDSGLYSILICAVDPVAVLSVFESMHIDKLVYNIVFGESLLNDGVAVVFYNAFKEMKSIPDVKLVDSISIMFGFFIYAFAISILLAFIMAIIVSFVTKHFYKHQCLQLIVIFSFNYLTYIIADSVKGSGILCLFFSIMIQRQYVQANLTHTTETMISRILSQLSLLSEGVIFIQMGLSSFSSTGFLKHTDVNFSLFLIAACYISRFIVVYSLGAIMNRFRIEKLDYRKALFIQAHGGLRGAIGFSLAFAIGDNFENRLYYQNSTIIMVFFSVYILGVTIKPLINICKIPREFCEDLTLISSVESAVSNRTKEGIKLILGSTSLRLKWEKWYRQMNNIYFKKLLMTASSVECLNSHSSVVKLYTNQSFIGAQTLESNSICNSQEQLLEKATIISMADYSEWI